MNDVFRFMLLRSPSPPESPSPSVSLKTTSFIVDLEDLVSSQEFKDPRQELLKEATSYLEKNIRINYREEYQKLSNIIQTEQPGDVSTNVDRIVEDVFSLGINELVNEDKFKLDKETLSNLLYVINITNETKGFSTEEILDALKIIDLLEVTANRIQNQTHSMARQSVVVEESDLYNRIKNFSDIPISTTWNDLPYGKYDSTAAPIDLSNEEEIYDLYKEVEHIDSTIKKLNSLTARDFKEPQLPGKTPTILPDAIKRFDAKSLEYFSMVGIDLENDPRDHIAKTLQALNDEKIQQLLSRYNSELDQFKYVLLPEGTVISQRPSFQGGKAVSSESSKPIKVKGKIKAVGIADLLVVKEKIKAYELGEIAHIENVLKGEKKERIHRKLERKEEYSIFETQSSKEIDEETSISERNELQHEANRIIDEELKNKSGSSYSISAGGSGGAGSYRFYIDGNVSGNKEKSRSSSKQESLRKATSFAREVINKAASRITEKKREEKFISIFKELEETNKHGLDNTDGDNHISGIYQWVEKIYEAQVFNLGPRMILDLVVPEPALYFRQATINSPLADTQIATSSDIDKLQLDSKTPYDLTITDIKILISKYSITGIPPLPPEYVTLAFTFGNKSESNEGTNAEAVKTKEATLPEGYQAAEASVIMNATQWDVGSDEGIFIVIGKHTYKYVVQTKPEGEQEAKYHNSPIWNTALDNQIGEIPIVVHSWATRSFSVSIEIKCKRTTDHERKWIIEAYDQIVEERLKQQSKAEEKIASARIQNGVNILGRNPEQNRKIERDELKKHCISIMTNQHYGEFNSFKGSDSSIEIDIDKSLANGLFIRFFEHAFDWQNMLTVYYPYFWSRKNSWAERVLIENVDPIHAEFLKAGAARVVLPVSEGFQNAVSRFLSSGNLPNEDELLDVTSSLYKPILDEIEARKAFREEEIPIEDSFEVRLPTQLIKLRKDDSLPRWDQ
ncbi:MAG: hypothetical protein F6K19_30860 [Cyanothece sp. SIO1E1]|nr:hypothetical protein [Cyanothece sp. SIO1E1]